MDAKSRALAQWMAGVVLATAGSAALAAWNFDSGASWSGSGVNTKATATSDGVTATASAFTVCNGSGSSLCSGNGAFAAGTAFAQSTLRVDTGYGLGVMSSGDSTAGGTHSIDNLGRTDMVLLSFSADVILDFLTVGWRSGDADISVLRYTGTTAPVIAGQNWNQLKATNDKDGWELVGSYNVTQNEVNQKLAVPINADDKVSSWWLISAFNTGFGGGTSSTTNNGNDKFKLASLGGTVFTPPPPPGQVSEPGSLALMGLALAGFVAARRRRTGRPV